MKLVTTEMDTKRESTSSAPVMAQEATGPQFEYGTRVTLSTELLDRLGFTVADFRIGQEVKVAGIGKIVSVSSSEYEGSKSQSVDIQIEDIGIEPKSASASEFDDAWGDSEK